MAKRKNRNITAQINVLTQVLFGVKIFRFVSFVYACLSFIFWFLNCFEVDWLWRFNWLFVIPYQLVGIVYKPEGVSADFSLAIIGGVSLFIGFVLDVTVNNLFNKIVSLEEEAERQINLRRMNERKPVKRAGIPDDPNQMEQSRKVFLESKLLFLIYPHVSKIKKRPSDLELTFQEVDVWKQRVNKKLIENVNYSKPMQKGYYRKNLFLMYKDFNYTDDFIYYIKPTLDSIILEFKKYGMYVQFAYVLSALAEDKNLEKELDCMDTILSLGFIDEIIVTNRFKLTYDYKPIQQYKAQIKGEYNLSKNLSVSNRQPVFSLVDIKSLRGV